jgi:RNA-splicing ligase RtcB
LRNIRTQKSIDVLPEELVGEFFENLPDGWKSTRKRRRHKVSQADIQKRKIEKRRKWRQKLKAKLSKDQESFEGRNCK